MFGDLVRVELFVWPTTSFDPLLANFKLGKALGSEKRQHQDVNLGYRNQPYTAHNNSVLQA